MKSFLLIVALCFVAFVGVLIFQVKREETKVSFMSPDQRLAYAFGSKNEHLVCPHCQTKGEVRAKRVSRTVTTTGNVGGILKTDTNSQTINHVTQHHCDKCGTTWDV